MKMAIPKLIISYNIEYSMASIFPVDGKTFNGKLFSRIRVAIESDVPHIYKLMQQLFIYHNITHLLKSTESSIASGLFNPKFPHLSPVTTLLVEVSAGHFPACPNGKTSSKVHRQMCSVYYHNLTLGH